MNQFRDKYLLRYTARKPYDKVEIWDLEIIDIPNPASTYYKNEVLSLYNRYEGIKNHQKCKDGDLIYGDEAYWMCLECAGMEYASKIFWQKVGEKR